MKKIIIIIICLMLISFLSFTFISHVIYHRSNDATILVLKHKIKNTKSILEEDGFSEYLETKYDNDYQISNLYTKNKISKYELDNSNIYTLKKNDKYKKIIIYIHGGAYVNSLRATHIKYLDDIVSQEDVMIYIPDYLVSPKYTYKESYELLTDLYKELLKEEKEIIIMGDSAGGGLALGFSMYTKELELESPDKVIVYSPWTDISLSNKKILEYESIDPILASYGLKEIGNLWKDDLDSKDYKVSPLYGDLTNLKEVYIFTGDRDILYPDTVKLFNKLKKNNIKSKLYISRGLIHNYQFNDIPEAIDTFNKTCEIINK